MLETVIELRVVVPVFFRGIVYLIVSPAESPAKPLSSLALVLEEINISPVRFRGCTTVLEFVIGLPYAGEPVTLETKGQQPANAVCIQRNFLVAVLGDILRIRSRSLADSLTVDSPTRMAPHYLPHYLALRKPSR